MEIRIPSNIYEKIFHWIDKADFEVSGFGKAVFDGKNFIVTEITLPKQEGSAAMTDIDAQALSVAQWKLKDVPGTLCFWWHSHVDMKAFMSGTDDDTIKMIAQNGLCVAVVFNKRREYHSVISYPYPFGGEKMAYQSGLPVMIQYPGLSEKEKEQAEQEYLLNVKEKVYKYTGPTYPKTNYTDYDNNYEWWEKYNRGEVTEQPKLPRNNTGLSAEEAAALADAEAGIMDDYDDLPEDSDPTYVREVFSEIREANALGMTVFEWRQAKKNANKRMMKAYRKKIRAALGTHLNY